MPGSGYLAHQTNVSCLWFDENYLQDSGNGNNFVLFFYLMKIRENDFFFLQVLIECGSASSFELSPRFANHPFRDRFSNSQDQVNQDLENEIQEAMTETVQTEDNLDGKLVIYFHLKKKIIYHFRIIFFLVSVLFFIYFSLILIIWFFVCDASQFLNNCLEMIF